jgi:hypothetical protein
MADDDDAVERALREAMAHRTAGTQAPPDLPARVRRRHRDRRRRLAALTAATAAALVGASLVYQGSGRSHTTAAKATPAFRPSALCAGLPITPQLTGADDYYRRHPAPPRGLRIDYLPRTVGRGPQGPWGTSALKGDFWYYGYGWSWIGSQRGVRGPEIAVQVVCGPAANSLDGLQIVSEGFRAETREEIRGMRAYEGSCFRQPVAFLLVADGLAVEVSASQVGRDEVGKVLRGIRVTSG